MKPKFSILTACHNNSPHLEDCIKSVMSQTFSDFEWIVVDDCSDDDSYDVLQQIDDSRVRLYRNDSTIFCSSTYLRALGESQGLVCGVLDADDALDSEAIKVILEYYNKYPNLTHIYTQHHWCNDKLKPVKCGLSSMPLHNSFVESAIRSRKHCYSHWRTFRTEAGKQAGIFPAGLRYAVDKHMGFALENFGAGGFLPKRLYYYRYHKKNMSRVSPGEQKMQWLKMARRFRKQRNCRKFVGQIRKLK